MTMPRQAIRASALVGAVLLALGWAAAPSRGEASRALVRPHALKLLINGRQLPITPFQGPDRYTPISTGKLRVEARWTGEARGSGYYVHVYTTEPAIRNFRTCFAGTSCLVRQSVPISAGEEMSWTVKIERLKDHALVSGFMVCLVGKS
jgi:hypothetical protein